MELMISTFYLTFAAAISIIIAQALEKISVNYISMLIGVIFALVPFLNHHVAPFNSETFMELIIAPLLFFEGQKTQLYNIRNRFKSILGITVVMVLFAVIAAGFSIHYLSNLGIALSFIIASISAPTDATATESVTNNLILPHKVEGSLKTESLFNDASGIILLDMALLWFENGTINYGQTLQNFLFSSLGGAAIGFVIGWIFIMFRQFLTRSRFNALNAQNIIYLLSPFLIYAIAEELSVSGIIAVVVAGLFHNAERQYSVLLNPRQVQIGSNLQSLISEIFNSIVFVILGLMIIRIGYNRILNSQIWLWLAVGTIIYLANLIVRFLYSLLIMKFDSKNAAIFALGGVHGAVTLALALTISQKFLGQSNYNLLMMSEATLILLSMIIPTIIFPFILPHQLSDYESQRMTIKFRNEMVKQAIIAVHHMYLPKKVKRHILFSLLLQKQAINTPDSLRQIFRTIDQPSLSSEERYLERLAYYRVFAIERNYLEEIAQKESKYQKCLLTLYNEILIAESLTLEDYIEE
ncbi:cation:proton antiporter [Lactobacillus sp. PV012]|uniref:cation:proton antiporter n=1 Tax=Lactobacillus sp. PV012 TaxID=2594494 RepID=UPI00223F225B|nr:sodium:proton antiporter [Lactobacillus sp. PV012]QNQ81715.1 sodium:proton antiporter [Lactobacillus sp. PV012]